MPRPTSFLDLPREIRDQIYNHLLISPTTLIEAIYPSHTPKPTRKQPPKQSRISIIPATCTPSPRTVTTPPSQPPSLLSLSICRVNTQTHHETQHIFWTHNILFSKHPLRSPTPHHPSLLKLLKAMGQSASRLITKIVILMPILDVSIHTLPKLFRSLDSRARHGAFKTLELRWQGEAWESLCKISHSIWYGGDSTHAVMTLYGQLEEGMRALGRGGRYDVDVYLPPHETAYEAVSEEDQWSDQVACLSQDLAVYTRGKVFWGDVMIFEGGRLVKGTVGK